MTKQIKISLFFLVFVALSFSGFKGYMWYYDQSKSYIRFEGKDEMTQFIEYKPSLFELRSVIESEGLSRDEAILKLLSQSLKGLPTNYAGCQIKKVFGNIDGHMLAQVRCEHGTKGF